MTPNSRSPEDSPPADTNTDTGTDTDTGMNSPSHEEVSDTHSQAESNSSDPHPSGLPPLDSNAYAPDRTGGVWTIDIPRLDKPPEFIPDPVPTHVAVAEFPDMTLSEFMQSRYDTIRNTASNPANVLTPDEPTQPNNKTDESLSQTLTQRTDTAIETGLTQLREFPSPTIWPREAYALVGFAAASTIIGGIVRGVGGGVGALVGITGILLVYVPIKYSEQFKPTDEDTENQSQLYNQVVTIAAGLVLFGLGVDFVTATDLIPGSV